MSRLGPLFEQLKSQGRRAVIPYLVAGDPNEAFTVPLMHALVEAGADIIEVGVPFSDPMSEGPTIQKGHERALEGGTSLKSTLALVKEFRRRLGLGRRCRWLQHLDLGLLRRHYQRAAERAPPRHLFFFQSFARPRLLRLVLPDVLRRGRRLPRLLLSGGLRILRR